MLSLTLQGFPGLYGYFSFKAHHCWRWLSCCGKLREDKAEEPWTRRVQGLVSGGVLKDIESHSQVWVAPQETSSLSSPRVLRIEVA